MPTWPRQKLVFYLAHSILKMEGSKWCQNFRTSGAVILPTFEDVYLLNSPTNLRHQTVFRAEKDLQEVYFRVSKKRFYSEMILWEAYRGCWCLTMILGTLIGLVSVLQELSLQCVLQPLQALQGALRINKYFTLNAKSSFCRAYMVCSTHCRDIGLSKYYFAIKHFF